MRNVWVIFVFCFLALGFCGCAKGKVQPVETSAVAPEIEATPQPQQLTPEQQQVQQVLKKNGFGNLGSKPTIIVVRKLPRKLVVYRGLTPLKTYPVVLGANPRNDKLCQGDMCTPEGVYRVVTKFDHPRWDKYILFDYPNTQNWLRFGRAKGAGQLPPEADIGGQVGIHGTEDPVKNILGENWTKGCVSMLNQDIEEVYPLVTDNTLIIIKKE